MQRIRQLLALIGMLCAAQAQAATVHHLGTNLFSAMLGNGAGLTNMTGASVTGTVPSATGSTYATNLTTADNILACTVADARVAATLARDSEVDTISNVLHVATIATNDVLVQAIQDATNAVSIARTNTPQLYGSLSVSNAIPDSAFTWNTATEDGYTFAGDVYSAQFHGSGASLTAIPSAQLTSGTNTSTIGAGSLNLSGDLTVAGAMSLTELTTTTLTISTNWNMALGTNANATQLLSGTVPDDRLASNVVRSNSPIIDGATLINPTVQGTLTATQFNVGTLTLTNSLSVTNTTNFGNFYVIKEGEASGGIITSAGDGGLTLQGDVNRTGSMIGTNLTEYSATLWGDAYATNKLTVGTAGVTITNLSAANQGAVFGPTSATLSYGGANTLFVGTNVGIGTTTPSGKLTIDTTSALVNSVESAGALVVRSTDANAADKGPQIRFSGNNSLDMYALGTIAARRENGNGSDKSGYLQFSTTLASGEITEKMRITTLGNVGIGTATPGKLLTLQSSTPTAGDAVLRLQTAAGNITTGTVIGDLEYYTQDASAGGTAIGARIRGVSEGTFAGNGNNKVGLSFWTLNSDAGVPAEAVRIDNQGNVGIGTTGPLSVLDVFSTVGTGNQTSGIHIKGGGVPSSVITDASALNIFNNGGTINNITFGDGTGYDLFFGRASDSGATKYMTIRDSGNVGIGLTAPLATLHTSNFTAQATAFRVDTTAGASSFLVNSNGTISVGAEGNHSYNGTNIFSDKLVVGTVPITDPGAGGTLTVGGPLTVNGAIGAGIVAATPLHAYGASNSTIVTVQTGEWATNLSSGDVFVNFSDAGGASVGDIAGVSSGLIAYNTFSGSHYTQVDDRTGLFPWAVMELDAGKPRWPNVLVTPQTVTTNTVTNLVPALVWTTNAVATNWWTTVDGEEVQQTATLAVPAQIPWVLYSTNVVYETNRVMKMVDVEVCTTNIVYETNLTGPYYWVSNNPAAPEPNGVFVQTNTVVTESNYIACVTNSVPKTNANGNIAYRKVVSTNYVAVPTPVNTTNLVTTYTTNAAVWRKSAIQDQLFKSKLADNRRSNKVIGVYAGQDAHGRDRVIGLGVGRVWVARVNQSTNGVALGDVLISSGVPGHAEVGDDNIIKSSTLGRATERVIWEVGETNRLISCVLKAG